MRSGASGAARHRRCKVVLTARSWRGVGSRNLTRKDGGTRRNMQRRTRRNTSTFGGAVPDTTIDRVDADRSGARPYHATHAVSEACDAGRAKAGYRSGGDSGRRAIERPALVGTRTAGRLPDGNAGIGTFDRLCVPARPAQHVHRRCKVVLKARSWSGVGSRNLTGKDGGQCKRRLETCNAGRAGTHLPSEALYRTRPSIVLTRIARETSLPRHTRGVRGVRCRSRDSRLSLRGRFRASRDGTPSLGRDALPGEPPEGCPMVTPALAPLIVYAFRRVRRSTFTEGAK